jgi:8-oxo-dGTP pyrophosphatase MutT (NUDIX family)
MKAMKSGSLPSRHPIQQTILEQLRTSPEGLRYAAMRPVEVENDLYNYHLKYLVQTGLAAKVDQRYRLTDEGKRELIEINPMEDGVSQRFKIASLCLVMQGSGPGLRLLYQRRTRQPFAGESGMIGGGLYRGELAAAAASRRVFEEAGLRASFRLLGMVRKRHFNEGRQLYSDILFHVCVAGHAEGEVIARNEFGEHTWTPLAQAVALESRTRYGSSQLARVLPLLAHTPPAEIPMFYFDEEYHYNVF